MKSFRDFLIDCNNSFLRNANFVLENFVRGNITIEQFSFLLSEGKFDREKAFDIMWNDFSTDPEINKELRRAAELLDAIDSPEPKKYLKKGSKDINPEWKEWKKNQSEDPEENSRGAQMFLSRAAELIKQKHKVIVTSRNLNSLKNYKYLGLKKKVKFKKLDVLNKSKIEKLLTESKPENIFYFAGQSSIVKSQKLSNETYESHYIGTKNFIEIIRKTNVKIKFFKAFVCVL